MRSLIMKFKKFAYAFLFATLATGTAFAFFPPVQAPTSTPVTVVKTPAPAPIKTTVIPPVDKCVKPSPKPTPKHTSYYCGCNNVSPQGVPEPATIISTGIGLGLAGIFGWRKKKAAAKTAAAKIV